MLHTHFCKICNETNHCSKASCYFTQRKLCRTCRRDNLVMFGIVAGTILAAVAVIAAYRFFRG